MLNDEQKVIEAIVAAGGNKTIAAEVLGVGRKSLWKYLHRKKLWEKLDRALAAEGLPVYPRREESKELARAKTPAKRHSPGKAMAGRGARRSAKHMLESKVDEQPIEFDEQTDEPDDQAPPESSPLPSTRGRRGLRPVPTLDVADDEEDE